MGIMCDGSLQHPEIANSGPMASSSLSRIGQNSHKAGMDNMASPPLSRIGLNSHKARMDNMASPPLSRIGLNSHKAGMDNMASPPLSRIGLNSHKAGMDNMASPPLSRIGLNSHKAGMEGLDKDKINQIIIEASKGSKYYQNELNKDREITKRVQQMLATHKTLSSTQKAATAKAADKVVEAMELSRDLTRIIVHVDMDAFYASVETRDRPELKELPMAVGSYSMLSTSNYVARRYGVRAAMPGFIAKKLCPHLVIVNPNYKEYQRTSEQVRAVLARYDPNFCPVGLDESYLDITEHVQKRVSETSNTRLGKSSGADCRGRSFSESEGDIWFANNSFQTDYRDHSSSGNEEDVCTCASESNSTDHTSHPSSETRKYILCASKSGGTDRKDCSSSEAKEDIWCAGNNSSFETEKDTVCASKSNGTDRKDRSSSDTEEDIWDNGDSYALSKLHWQHAEQVVCEMRESIFRATGITASAGIAPNKMLAKVASDLNKPNGQFLVEPTREGVLSFVQDLPIRKICGIGKVTEKMLNALDITLCRHLYEKRDVLHLLFSQTTSRFFLAVSLGIASTVVQRSSERKSMSVERSFGEMREVTQQMSKCQELCQILAEDMQQEGIKGRTVTIKLKTVHFEVKSRGVTVSSSVCKSEELYQLAGDLLQQELRASGGVLSLRLMGVRVSSFDHLDSGQQSLRSFLKPRETPPSDSVDVAIPDILSTADQSQSSGSVPSSPGHEDLRTSTLHASACTTDPVATYPADPHDSRNSANNVLHATCSDPDDSRTGVNAVATGLPAPHDFRTNTDNTAGAATCPVCGAQVSNNNTTLNQHIDECLNRSAIKEATNTRAIQTPSQRPLSHKRTQTSLKFFDHKRKRKQSGMSSCGYEQ